MTTDDKEAGDLEKLLADVQRTIRDNKQFIRCLKEEAVSSDEVDDVHNESGSAEDEYEEL